MRVCVAVGTREVLRDTPEEKNAKRDDLIGRPCLLWRQRARRAVAEEVYFEQHRLRHREFREDFSSGVWYSPFLVCASEWINKR